MKKIKNIAIVDFVLLYIATVSLLNVFLLAIGNFYPVISLLSSLLILILLTLIFRVKLNFQVKSYSLLLIPIILIAFFIRLRPNLYLTGGQDPGSYVSLSRQYELNRSLYIKDEIREELTEYAEHYYDKGNIFLGVEQRDEEESIYVMPFYPVSPSWMSILGTVLGSDNRVYALTFFGVLSVLGMYLLSYEVSNKNKKVALLSSFLLAINPLHVYFSRTPSTEVVYLTFLLFMLYFFFRWLKEYRQNKASDFSLIMALICSNAMFYTRMNAVFLLPILLVTLLLSITFIKEKPIKRKLSRFSILWLLSFVLSFVLYRVFLPNLFDKIVGNRLLSYLGSSYAILALLSISFLLLISFIVRKSRNVLKRVIKCLYRNINIIFLIVLFLLIGYELYFYIKEIFITNSYTLFSYESLSLLKQQSFLATLLYLSPLGFVILPFAVFHFGKEKDFSKRVLILLLTTSLIYCWGVLRLTQYHYYFVRYQLSELIPISILFISIGLVGLLNRKKFKIVSFVIIAIISLYFGYFSVIQHRDIEGSNREAYEYLDGLLDKDDAIFLVRSELSSFHQIALPMRYYYDMELIPLLSITYANKFDFQEMKRSYEDAYMLTTIPTLEKNNPVRYELIRVLEFKNNYFVHCLRDEDKYFEMVGHSEDIPFCEYIVIPNRYYYGSYKMYLYRWK